MEPYTTEEEQLEALRRWWNENGRSIVVAVVIALAGTVGWQTWQSNKQQQEEAASDMYQAMLREIGGPRLTPENSGIALAEQLKSDFSGTTYAQFAALHLAAIAVNDGALDKAEQELRWVLGKASKGSDTAEIAQLRLARVLAARGETDQALAILSDAGQGAYAATYSVAEGDILLAAGRREEARRAYGEALAQSGGGDMVNLPALQQKIQSLTPVPPQPLEAAPGVESVDAEGDVNEVPQE